MIYKVIGLMSGSSLDGLDIVYVQLEETRGQWTFEVKAAECMAYNQEWLERLSTARQLSVPDFLRLHTAYGHYTATQISDFIAKHDLEHKVDFVATHGHTIFHDPAAKTTFQLGDGAAIAAHLALPVISDLRSMDVALGGQGAPIVPVGDRLLFGQFGNLLNLGGIANVTVKQGDQYLAFDICPNNQLLNYYAQKAGLAYDEGGNLAATGKVNESLLQALDGLAYYHQAPPKSLANEFSVQEIIPVIDALELDPADALATCVLHIAQQITKALVPYANPGVPAIMLATGGGALNTFLVRTLQDLLQPTGISMVLPDAQTIQYKEAVVMALIGALRWREEENVYASVTGATRDSVGGAFWMGR